MFGYLLPVEGKSYGIVKSSNLRLEGMHRVYQVYIRSISLFMPSITPFVSLGTMHFINAGVLSPRVINLQISAVSIKEFHALTYHFRRPQDFTRCRRALILSFIAMHNNLPFLQV
jgi:hypothetical protein